jgi:hypothetical protein
MYNTYIAKKSEFMLKLDSYILIFSIYLQTKKMRTNINGQKENILKIIKKNSCRAFKTQA